MINNNKDKEINSLELLDEITKIDNSIDNEYLRLMGDVVIAHIPISLYLNNEVGYYHAKASQGERNEKVNCPVHGEKTPSFFYNDGKGIYNCFGCGSHGTVIHLHKELTGLNYYESCEDLIKLYNLSRYLKDFKVKQKKQDKVERHKLKVKELRSLKNKNKVNTESISKISQPINNTNIMINKVITLLHKIEVNPQLLKEENKDDFYVLIDKILIYQHCNEDIYKKVMSYVR